MYKYYKKELIAKFAFKRWNEEATENVIWKYTKINGKKDHIPGRALSDRWNTLIAASIEPLFACHVA